MKLGVCYYPEHWPATAWAADAARMTQLGISLVRIGEFAWSRLEPRRGQYELEWLAQALDTLAKAGLSVVMGTPTATPPKWLIDEHPDILAIDENGQEKRFGSRRHYCFSSQRYRHECRRIVTLLVEKFGRHPAISAWQTDNEYGCHSTIASYSDDALSAFRQWCATTYTSIEDLNKSWGNVFWSMEYASFDEIALPCSAVTEMNPAHRLAFWRFSSAQVRSFNLLQVSILREHSPGRDMLHNYMGNFTEFDHYEVAQDLDIATWDNYPLGFLDRDSADIEEQKKWYRTGHPDSSAFHHDLYRGVGKGRLWVIEQQPGPVNWAPHNPSPLDGMVRLWGWEACAHGAEAMCWFRWRQAPFAQEQMHSGLLLPDGSDDAAVAEVARLHAEISQLKSAQCLPACGEDSRREVALVFDYTGDHILQIQPQGQNFNSLGWVQSIYTACRHSGVNIDIVSGADSLEDYALVILANSVVINDQLIKQLKDTQANILIGPRCGSKTYHYSIPTQLPPGPLQALIDIKITRVESLPDFVQLPVDSDGGTLTVRRWREKICTDLTPAASFADGWGFHYQQKNVHYLNGCLDAQSLRRFIQQRLLESHLHITDCEHGLRIRRQGDLIFAFNYGPEVASPKFDGNLLIGNEHVAAGELAIWHSPHPT